MNLVGDASSFEPVGMCLDHGSSVPPGAADEQ
jgi:hypothetical protein